jgi:hypothetical protein
MKVLSDGSAPGSGPGGRRFKSSRPDHFLESIPGFSINSLPARPFRLKTLLDQFAGINKKPGRAADQRNQPGKIQGVTPA